MRIFLTGLVMLMGIPCYSSTVENSTWFTVMGSVSDPTVDSVQLDIKDIQPRGQIKLMNLRVTLRQKRTSTSGEEYASYISRIAIDCASDSIVHLEQTRFAEQMWLGKSNFQSFPEVRPMAFGGLNPSPKARILKAACALKHPG